MPHKLIHTLNDDFLKAFGAIVVLWGALEVCIDTAIAIILNTSEGAHAAMTIGIGVQFRLDMLNGLAETTLASKRQRKQLIEIIKRIRIVEGDRNFIMHASWMQHADKVSGYVGRRNIPGHRKEQWGIEKFKEVETELSILGGELLDIVVHGVRRRRGSWHDRHQKPPQKSPSNGRRGNAGAKQPRQPPS